MFTDNCIPLGRSACFYWGAIKPLPEAVTTSKWIYRRALWRFYAKVTGPGVAGLAAFLKAYVRPEVAP